MESLIDVFEEIQLEILTKLIELSDIEQADRKQQADELNEFVIALILLYKSRITSVLLANIEQAERKIDRHTQDNWDIAVEHDTQMEKENAADMLNTFILLALMGTTDKPSLLMTDYMSMWSEGRVYGLKDRESYRDAIKRMRQAKFTDGFRSLYYNFREALVEQGIISEKAFERFNKRFSDDATTETNREERTTFFETIQDATIYYVHRMGKEPNYWRMDRVIRGVEDSIYSITYQRAIKKALKERNEQLVTVGNFAEPRPACEKLQASGIICVVPREMASADSNRYPNIYDTEHRYLSFGGHHGADGNCRHLWHALDNEPTEQGDMYAEKDQRGAKFWQAREMFNRLLT